MAERGTSTIGAAIKQRPIPVRKRTSQGLRTMPLNKSKRRSWKAYRGQGRP